MKDENSVKLELKKWQIYFLFAYYSLISLGGGVLSAAIYIPGPLSNFDYMGLAVIGSASMACTGSAIYYFRKLYKAMLNRSLTVALAENNLNALGAFAYFVARPMFSIVFGLLVVIGIKSGLILSGASSKGVDYGYVQMTMFFSFFVGFLSGRFVRRLETWGETLIDHMSKGEKK